MVLSINTNLGALVALQHLNRTNDLLERSELNIITGLRVNGPKDDASTYAIAQNMRGDVAGMTAVKQALASGESIVDVAIEAAKAISDTLILMKAKAVQASQEGLDAISQAALNNDFISLMDQIESIVNSAEFNGTNLLDDSLAADVNVLSTIDGQMITVMRQDMTLDTGLSISALTLSTPALAQAALIGVDAAIDDVSAKLAALGSVGKRIELQSAFTTQLKDILTAGIGNLVDADMAEENARLQALQVKQQLGIQALSIANSAPQSILQLFAS